MQTPNSSSKSISFEYRGQTTSMSVPQAEKRLRLWQIGCA
ncbi:hypothetical protein SAMN05216258_105149 [Albimonas pacifica]|uniref:Uncharacterized protein n=1 Tax=Albimonas pacifica TaxID=1114924 RepID=A0A1I3GG79_9RHOB|nr:hypothetical protein SAMN05216258_105149 [Albimonas pacifica]